MRRGASDQRITGHWAWPEEDFPRTLTLKVKKAEVEASLREAMAASAPGAVAERL